MFQNSPRILVTFLVTPDCSQKLNIHMSFPENKILTPIYCHGMDWYISYSRYGMGIFPIIFSLYGTIKSLKMENL